MPTLIRWAGRVGSYFRGGLAAASVEARRLVRPSLSELLIRQGLIITNPFGDVPIPVETSTQATSPFDADRRQCCDGDVGSTAKRGEQVSIGQIAPSRSSN